MSSEINFQVLLYSLKFNSKFLITHYSPSGTLVNIWRLCIINGCMISLGFFLIQNGSQLQFTKQLITPRKQSVSRYKIMKSIDLKLPKSLLFIDSREIIQKLVASLPVQSVQVNRLIKPPRLQIQLEGPVPVVMAQRRSPNGMQKGLIDEKAHWIDTDRIQITKEKLALIRIRGWQNLHRATIAEVLSQRGQFRDSLKEIRIDPDGTLWLVLSGIGPIRFGLVDEFLSFRLKMLSHLCHVLPAKIEGRRSEFIDVSCMEQPEIGFLNQSEYRKKKHFS
uniref:POTRA domain-containing protein n=1 Tax=Paulinella chromatophora TaxID=39717 RepID=B1X3L8_PAUCH|nr:hypothetical protein PCC_0082 [Paulinella chromatophora]ACB42537.1 hypothetical protein PCC_0082 [Paulinella chromatophora]